ncbi:hypothetical protein ACTQ34_09040 [Agathobaculum sp. LCP25S3_E8]|uniref:hypothetical protein n=1 Tax=Agathobaculum sp. LCP25S3_E8 TaxID=3438735 RepID=UPI003F917E2F
MRSIEQLEKNQRMNAKKLPSVPDEETEEEMEFRAFEPVNTAASIFDRDLDKRFGGINTAPSIFDRGAVFHTRQPR